MLRDYSGTRLFWTRHAAAEAIEDDLDPMEIEGALRVVVELPEFNGEKKRGIIKIGERYCTLIYVKKRHGLVVITCWESSQTDVKEYKNETRRRG